MNDLNTMGELVGKGWFAVWGRDALGDCTCRRGKIRQEVRSVAMSGRGLCDSPGKHPLWVRLPGGEVFGWPNGLRDSVTFDEFVSDEVGLWSSAHALGGQPAVVVPDDYWVLDVDSEPGWASLVALFRCGAVDFDRVAAVVRTRRGWHVWLRVDGGRGWRSGTAQRAVNAALEALGRKPAGLDVKSGGGYVVLPWGDPAATGRSLVDVRKFAERVAWSARLRRGTPAGDVGRLAVGDGPAAVAATAPASLSPESFGEDPSLYAEYSPSSPPEYDPELFGMAAESSSGGAGPSWPGPDSYGLADALAASRMATLRERSAIVAGAGEGKRNVMLNLLGYLEGRAAIEAGCDPMEVRAVLRAAGLGCGLGESEVEATIRSSLQLGWNS